MTTPTKTMPMMSTDNGQIVISKTHLILPLKPKEEWNRKNWFNNLQPLAFLPIVVFMRIKWWICINDSMDS